jgi:hypothetical protein
VIGGTLLTGMILCREKYKHEHMKYKMMKTNRELPPCGVPELLKASCSGSEPSGLYGERP